MHFLHIGPRRQFPLREHVPDVPGDHRLVALEELGHLRLRQPYRIALEPHVESDLSIGGAIQDYLTARALGRAAHAVASAMPGPSGQMRTAPSMRDSVTLTVLMLHPFA